MALTLNHNENNNYFFDGKQVGYDFTIKVLDEKFRPIGSEDMDFINKIFAVRHQTLELANTVTGIVTGDDEKFIDKDSSEPVITGKHIEPYRITGEKYINYEEVKGQIAIAVKDSYFRTPEKLIYHTVSRHLEFAIDTDSRLDNLHGEFLFGEGESRQAKCIMAIFNSFIYNRLNKLLFGDKGEPRM